MKQAPAKKLKENGKIKRLDKIPYAIYIYRIGYIKRSVPWTGKIRAFLKH
jgi:hypothetical protein